MKIEYTTTFDIMMYKVAIHLLNLYLGFLHDGLISTIFAVLTLLSHAS